MNKAELQNIAAALAAPAVTFCVDTNILVEFQALDAIPWRQLVPNANEIRIIVPTKVAEEMDEHKKKSGRLRRRGIEFSATARAIEESDNGEVEVRATDPRITIEFGPTFRRSKLDADLFDLEDPDGRVVAEVMAIARQIPGVILLADDSKPIRLARHAELLCTRPMDGWRRADGPDERDATITELKRELGAAPILSLSLPSSVDERHRHVIESGGESTPPEIADIFLRVVTEICDPRVPRSEIIAKHGLRPTDPYGIANLTGTPGVTPTQLGDYDREFDKYVDRVQKLVHQLHRLFNVHGPALPVTIEAGNDGDRAADRVLVEATLSGNFRFIPPDSLQDVIKGYLKPPKAPKPDTLPFGLRSFVGPVSPPEPRRADVFYDQDEASIDAHTQYISWRCEELRQGVHDDLPAMIVATDAAATGALKVTISSAVMAKKTILTAPLSLGTQVPAAMPIDYLMRRLDLLPKRYRKPLRMELEKLAVIQQAGG